MRTFTTCLAALCLWQGQANQVILMLPLRHGGQGRYQGSISFESLPDHPHRSHGGQMGAGGEAGA